MTVPSTYTAIRRAAGEPPLRVEASTETLPKELGSHDVLARIHAVSLNYRDVAMLHGKYPGAALDRGITASDCAADVLAVGPDVEDFAVGDRVSACVTQEDVSASDDEQGYVALGGDVDGVLRQYAVFKDRNLVHLPKHVSWEEGSTIACAGVTAWAALNGLKGLSEDTSVLLEGTGGVSMFALLILAAAGIKTIITSSSDAKIATVKKLGPLIEGINYKTHPDVDAEVMRLTNGIGAKAVINNIGVPSIPSNIRSISVNATISMLGMLGGLDADWTPRELMTLIFKRSKIQGILIGTRTDFKTLNAFLEKEQVQLTPLIDRTFSLEESQEAFDYLYSAKHVGKVVIKI